MSAANDGGPAFPSPDVYYPNGQIEYGAPGMTLRDYFAAAALTGLCGNSTWLNNVRAKGHNSCETAAGAAYEAADAMLAAREVKKEVSNDA